MRHIILIGLLLLTAVSVQAQVRVDYNKSIDFSKYKTFRFEPGKVIRKLGVRDTNTTFLDQYIDDAVTKDLISKGLSPTNGKAALVITYLAGAREKEEVQNYMMNPGFYPYSGFYGYGGWWGPQWNNFWVHRYEEGTVIIDVYDAKQAQLVWRAYAVSSISKFNEKKFIGKEVHKSFKHFPPRA